MSAPAVRAAALLALVPLTGVATPAAASTVWSPGCAATIVRGLDLRERVGQLLMIGVPVDNTAGATAVITSYQVGSIFLAGRSYRSVPSIRASTDSIQSLTKRWTGLSSLVAVDQEGGAVQSLRGPGFRRIPSALRQGALAPATLRAQTGAWSAELRAAGVTMNLAPVADTVSISPASANPPIGAFSRQYGNDPATVSRAMAAVVPAMQGQRVAAALKHFPGLGRVRYNTDTSTRAVDSIATVTDPNLAPFGTGIRAGARVVMLSSARYPRLDPAQPAVFSRPIISDLLQERLGFRGVVMTDDIGAAAAMREVPLGDRAIRFVNAGGHLVLSVRTADAGPLSNALTARAQSDPVFARRVDSAAIRVVQSKIDAGLASCS